MTLLIIFFALIAAASVGFIISLLYRLNRFQCSETIPQSLFLRSWSYILMAENYTEAGRQLLPRLRISLAILAISVIAAVVSLVVFVQGQAR